MRVIVMDCLHNPLSARECATIWRAHDLGDLELLHARYFSYSFAKHTHEGVALGVIEAGAESFYYRGARHTATTGQVVVFNPNEAHTGEAADSQGWRFRMFYMDAGLMRKAVEDLSGKPADIPFFSAPVIDQPETAAMLRNLHILLEGESCLLERESKFLWTLAEFARCHADSRPSARSVGDEHSIVRTVREYLEEQYTENVSLDALVALSGISGYHLIRVFRKEIGLPPHAYLEQVRVNRGRQLLRAGVRITDAALLTGFTDQSHFNRHFKKMTGVTPGQYSKMARTPKIPIALAQTRKR